jgi:arginine N-succinyltransferase
MLVVRNACEDDLDAILELARGIGHGMTTLKPDAALLAGRLALAQASFAGTVRPHEADYLFVLEDLARARICGVSAIKGAVGVEEPFYNYRISTSVHTSPATGRVNRVQSLHLTHDLSGASELCSLYLHPDYRKGTNGKLLSKSRFLFLAQFPSLFARKVFAEMRGFQDERGQSPFWESVGRPFFDMDFHEADDMCGKGDRQFIEQLVPRLPLYTHLLGEPARAAIGCTHVDTAPARRLLEQEGLHFDGYIDIFDGGPVLEANILALRALRESRLQVAGAGQQQGAEACLVATTHRERFRVVVADVAPGTPTVRLGREVLDALEGEHGMPVRVLSMHPQGQTSEPWMTKS